jgi:hypothetical protein
MWEEEAWGVASSCIVEDVGGEGERRERGRRERIGRGWEALSDE